MRTMFRKLHTGVLATVLSVAVVGQLGAEADRFLDPLKSMVRVHATTQDYDFQRPWAKKASATREALGAVVGDGMVLVTASLLANHTYIELEKPMTGAKTPAEPVVIDYEINLALLRPVETDFLDGFEALPIDETLQVGDALDFWQLEASGAALVTGGMVTTVEVSRYILDGSSFLVARVNAPLEYRAGSYTVPVVDPERQALAGMLMRYNPRSQSAEVIPGILIERFLKNADADEYIAFPRAGFSFSALRDPQFRRYLGMEGRNGGIYLTRVEEDGPASRAGLEEGDVLLKVAGHAVDQNGNYEDPRFGLISIGHLLRGSVSSGDEVAVRILRDGEEKEALIRVEPKPLEDYVSEPYTIDRGPNFIVVGGLVFQELSRQYLQEWGGDWRKRAPLRLVYLDEMQEEAAGDREKIVFLSNVLPLANTIGYEDLRHLVLQRVNGREIGSLAELADALASIEADFHRFEFDEHPSLIILDASETEEVNQTLQELYGLPMLERLE